MHPNTITSIILLGTIGVLILVFYKVVKRLLVLQSKKVPLHTVITEKTYDLLLQVDLESRLHLIHKLIGGEIALLVRINEDGQASIAGLNQVALPQKPEKPAEYTG